MQIYADPTFDMACEQFRMLADYLNLDGDLRQRMLYPKRAMAVMLPVRRDDGSVAVFEG